MTDFRALCAELVDVITAHAYPDKDAVGYVAGLLTRARASLAEQPVGPTDEELLKLTENVSTEHLYAHRGLPSDWDPGDYCSSPMGLIEFARAVLARWGQPAVTPVPVSERLPEPGEWVWHCYAGVRFWEHGRYNDRQFFIGDGPESQPATHWLPAHALPVPTVEEVM